MPRNITRSPPGAAGGDMAIEVGRPVAAGRLAGQSVGAVLAVGAAGVCRLVLADSVGGGLRDIASGCGIVPVETAAGVASAGVATGAVPAGAVAPSGAVADCPHPDGASTNAPTKRL